MRSAIVAIIAFLFLASCSPAPTNSHLIAFRFEPPAIVQLSSDLSDIETETPLNIPLECSLWDLYPQPVGSILAIELSCPGGPTVVLFNLETAELSRPVSEQVDSHFLAWDKDGLYLRIDSLGNPRIVHAKPGVASAQEISIDPQTYDLAPAPDGRSFTYSFSRGLGYGSEIWLKRGGHASRLLADPDNIIAFTRWSPDGKQIVFIKIPDTQTPFTVGELWLMDADGQNPHFLAEADAGHGYEAAWSPDGKQVAFVQRENPEETAANQSAMALVSNLYLVETESGSVTSLTQIDEAVVETPHWSPDGSFMAFNVIANGTMNVWIADMAGGQVRPALTGAACCPAWMRK